MIQHQILIMNSYFDALKNHLVLRQIDKHSFLDRYMTT